MELKLSFAAPFESIVNLAPCTLPPFTVLTGLNGAGKTHFLRAIDEGNILVEGVSSRSSGGNEIRYFDWTTLAPSAEGTVQSEVLARELTDKVNKLFAHMAPHREAIINAARQLQLPDECLRHPRLGRMSDNEILQWQPNPEVAVAASNKLREVATSASNKMLAALRARQVELYSVAIAIAQEVADPIVCLTKRELLAKAPSMWGNVALFQQAFGRLFVQYRDVVVANKLKRLAKADGDQSANPLDEGDFLRKHNIPPWDFVNDVFEHAGLDFAVNKPDLYGFTPFAVELRKKSTGTLVSFNTLSSGERVLMGFANCVYYARDNRQTTSFPKLLLLDEIDAPLHPSMTRQILGVIMDTLMRNGIGVIATTHSPTTVALAPEASLYAMSATEPRLTKITKNEALGLLLRDVPTLNLNYSGRRQVFVESDRDVEIYEKIYFAIGQQKTSERSLTFMSASSRREKGDADGGADQVKRVVGALEAANNNSVFGIVDWDGKRTSTLRIKVLAEGTRDGLENCIFDPLVLAIAINRDATQCLPSIGLAETISIMQFKHYDCTRLQQIVDEVQSFIVPNSQQGGLVSCAYEGGLHLMLRRDFLTLDDHQLEQVIKEKVPPFKRFTRAGDLVKQIVTTVFMDFPEYVPTCFRELFDDLLQQDLK